MWNITDIQILERKSDCDTVHSIDIKISIYVHNTKWPDEIIIQKTKIIKDLVSYFDALNLKDEHNE